MRSIVIRVVDIENKSDEELGKLAKTLVDLLEDSLAKHEALKKFVVQRADVY